MSNYKEQSKKQILKTSKIRDLLEKQFPPQEWIIQNIVPEEGVILLSAQPASFKTWLMLEITRVSAEGSSLLGEFSANQTAALIIDEESGERQLNNHFKILGVDKDLPIYYSSLSGNLLNEEYVEQIIDFAKEKKIKLVIFDSLTRFHSKDENDASAMAQVMAKFTKLKKNGISSLIIHHNRKLSAKQSFSSISVSNDIRGSSDIFAACDIHISLFRNGNTIKVVQTKNRYNEELAPFTAKFVKVDNDSSRWEFGEFGKTAEIKMAELGEKIYQIIKENQGINQKDIISITKKLSSDFSDVVIKKILSQLVETNRLNNQKGTKNEKLYFTMDYVIEPPKTDTIDKEELI